jgi:hypothetical protein
MIARLPELFSRRPIAAILVAAAFALSAQPYERINCGSNIISPTVVATFCGHRLGDNEMLDLLILWRGNPGWFRRGGGGTGGGGSNLSGGGTKGHVSQYSIYGDVYIGFDADFDAATVKIGDVTLPLTAANTVMVDDTDGPGDRRIAATRWTEPQLPLGGDTNLVLAQRSREVLDYLRCDIPMPAPLSRTGSPYRLPIVTVCEKLKPK